MDNENECDKNCEECMECLFLLGLGFIRAVLR